MGLARFEHTRAIIGNSAVLEPIIGNSVVTLAAASREPEFSLHARCDLDVVDAREAKRLRAALVLLLSDILRIGQCGLIIGTASVVIATLGIQARLGH